jgi:hypothetical protein
MEVEFVHLYQNWLLFLNLLMDSRPEKLTPIIEEVARQIIGSMTMFMHPPYTQSHRTAVFFHTALRFDLLVFVVRDFTRLEAFQIFVDDRFALRDRDFVFARFQAFADAAAVRGVFAFIVRRRGAAFGPLTLRDERNDSARQRRAVERNLTGRFTVTQVFAATGDQNRARDQRERHQRFHFHFDILRTVDASPTANFTLFK